MDQVGKLLIGTSLALMGVAFYRSFHMQKQSEKPKQQQITNHSSKQEPTTSALTKLNQQIQKQMSKHKLLANPTVEECKVALSLVFHYTLQNMVLHNQEFKKRRNAAKKETIQQMRKYLLLLVEGFQQSKKITTDSKNKAYELLHTDGQIFTKYSSQLSQFKRQLKKQSIASIKGISQITEQQLRHILKTQIEFYEHKGQSFAKKIAKCIAQWHRQSIQTVLKLLSIIIIDESLGQEFPQVDQMQIQHAKKIYGNSVLYELKRLQHQETKFYSTLLENLNLSDQQIYYAG